MTATTRRSARPDIRRHVAVCLSCHHWQLDFRAAAVSDLGGWTAAMHALAEEHVAHLAECPGAGGRVKVLGRWVEPPKMQSGNPADGTLGIVPLPAWWVTR